MSQVLKGGQEVGDGNQDGWIMLFTRDAAVTDMFKLVPNICSTDDKEEKNLYINRLVVFHSWLPSVLWDCSWQIRDGNVPFPPVDNIWVIIIVWRMKGKIIRTVLSCNSVQCYAHTYEQFLQLTVGLGLGLLFCMFFFCLSFCSCFVCFCFVRYSFFSTMPRDWLGRTLIKREWIEWNGVSYLLFIIKKIVHEVQIKER